MKGFLRQPPPVENRLPLGQEMLMLQLVYFCISTRFLFVFISDFFMYFCQNSFLLLLQQEHFFHISSDFSKMLHQEMAFLNFLHSFFWWENMCSLLPYIHHHGNRIEYLLPPPKGDLGTTDFVMPCEIFQLFYRSN